MKFLTEQWVSGSIIILSPDILWPNPCADLKNYNIIYDLNIYIFIIHEKE